MTAVFLETITELDRKNRELTARVTALENDRTEDRERLNAHGLLLTTARRRDALRHYEAQLAQVREAA
jgi:replicative superfamily II helicase